MMTLSPRQKDALAELKTFISKNSYPPTSRELGIRMGINQNAAMNHIRALVRKGVIKHQPNRARTITIIATGQ